MQNMRVPKLGKFGEPGVVVASEENPAGDQAIVLGIAPLSIAVHLPAHVDFGRDSLFDDDLALLIGAISPRVGETLQWRLPEGLGLDEFQRARLEPYSSIAIERDLEILQIAVGKKLRAARCDVRAEGFIVEHHDVP